MKRVRKEEPPLIESPPLTESIPLIALGRIHVDEGDKHRHHIVLLAPLGNLPVEAIEDKKTVIEVKYTSTATNPYTWGKCHVVEGMTTRARVVIRVPHPTRKKSSSGHKDGPEESGSLSITLTTGDGQTTMASTNPVPVSTVVGDPPSP